MRTTNRDAEEVAEDACSPVSKFKIGDSAQLGLADSVIVAVDADVDLVVFRCACGEVDKITHPIWGRIAEIVKGER